MNIVLYNEHRQVCKGYLLDEEVPHVVVGVDNTRGLDLRPHSADDLVFLLLRHAKERISSAQQQQLERRKHDNNK